MLTIFYKRINTFESNIVNYFLYHVLKHLQSVVKQNNVAVAY